MNGLHILAEFHACEGERRLLLDAGMLASLCRRSCAAAGLAVVAEAFHQFADFGMRPREVRQHFRSPSLAAL